MIYNKFTRYLLFLTVSLFVPTFGITSCLKEKFRKRANRNILKVTLTLHDDSKVRATFMRKGFGEKYEFKSDDKATYKYPEDVADVTDVNLTRADNKRVKKETNKAAKKEAKTRKTQSANETYQYDSQYKGKLQVLRSHKMGGLTSLSEAEDEGPQKYPAPLPAGVRFQLQRQLSDGVSKSLEEHTHVDDLAADVLEEADEDFPSSSTEYSAELHVAKPDSWQKVPHLPLKCRTSGNVRRPGARKRRNSMIPKCQSRPVPRRRNSLFPRPRGNPNGKPRGRGRRIAERLLHYENHYSSGTEGHPPRFYSDN